MCPHACLIHFLLFHHRTLSLSLPINPHTLIQLMKLIPPREFMKDDIQRIFRFVKQHEKISEREYLEAVDMSGQNVGG